MVKEQKIQCDLLIIGAGLSGMSAAYFAAQSGLSVVQVSKHRTMGFHSGLLDVAAISPSDEQIFWADPQAAIQAITKSSPKHPYSKIDSSVLTNSFMQIVDFLRDEGIDYEGSPSRNQAIITAVGTTRSSCFFPKTMYAGVKALQNKEKTLIVDFAGLREFSARQIAETAKRRWPTLVTARIEFPGLEGRQEISVEHMARALENEVNLLQLIEKIKPHVTDDIDSVALPAILGVYKTRKILAVVEEKLRVPVFEIPSLPPSVPGLRLQEAFDRRLSNLGVLRFNCQSIDGVESKEDNSFVTGWKKNTDLVSIQSRGIVLATGRFLGKGLVMDRDEIKETLFGFPVTQPEHREDYYRADFFSNKGHSINRAGIETDCMFRPLKIDSKPFYSNLFSIGTINAHQDWVREKSGSGIAITSAYKSVQAFSEMLKKSNESRQYAG